MQSSTSTCWKMSTHRGFAEQPLPSRAKMLNPGLRAENAIGSPTFASLPEEMLRGPVHKRACRQSVVALLLVACAFCLQVAHGMERSGDTTHRYELQQNARAGASLEKEFLSLIEAAS